MVEWLQYRPVTACGTGSNPVGAAKVSFPTSGISEKLKEEQNRYTSPRLTYLLPSSNGQDLWFSSIKSEFDSPWQYKDRSNYPILTRRHIIYHSEIWYQ